MSFAFRRFATIVLGGGDYFGWDLGVENELQLRESLKDAYNEGVDAINGQLTRKDLLFGGGMSKVTLQQIPGYVPSGLDAAKAVNIPALAQAVFNLRTSNQ